MRLAFDGFVLNRNPGESEKNRLPGLVIGGRDTQHSA